jgi:hypothetical protein
MLELQTSVTVKISYHKEKRSTYHILENITGNSLAPGHICTYTIAGVVGMVRIRVFHVKESTAMVCSTEYTWYIYPNESTSYPET